MDNKKNKNDYYLDRGILTGRYCKYEHEFLVEQIQLNSIQPVGIPSYLIISPQQKPLPHAA